jgi:adenylosuccinate synthase
MMLLFWLDILMNDNLITNFIRDYRFLLTHTEPADDSVVRDYDSLIFEGGQGLLLDQSRYSEAYPHTTPSNTGLQNPVKILKSAFDVVPPFEACYVSRTYLTRHGAGPLPDECDKSAIAANIVDETNIPNDYQGAIRFAPLNVPELYERVQTDLQFAEGLHVTPSVAFTHLNERGLTKEKCFICPWGTYLSDNQTRDSIRKLNTVSLIGAK